MNSKLINIIKEIDEKKKVNYNEIFTEYKLDDLDTLTLIAYCLKNDIDSVNETVDINFKLVEGKYFSDSEVIDFFENYIENEEDFGDDLLNRWSKLVLAESIKNTKINFSILDVKQEALISMIRFKNDFYNKLSETYSKEQLEYILVNFVKKDMLAYQKLEISKISEQEYAHLLYIKINSQIDEGKTLDEILTSLGITMSYYEELEKIYGEISESLDYDQIIEEMERVKRKYDLALKVNKINYLEENAIIGHLGLESEKSEVTKDREKFVKEAIFKLSLIYSIEILDDLESEDIDVSFD